ncbi:MULTISPECIES: site-specific integrase [unclassified Eikenella]|uniref:tyrosine-type recombinase/integrase n=1 Tax=unclassified Eikenella TaxID=2639367 RepID=UPI001E3E80B0|nr:MULTISPECIES: site-specific integrase [unclassified Eikenella]
MHDKLKHELWRQEKLGEKPKHLWDEACIRWLQENQGKKSLDGDKNKIRLLPELRGLLLEDMTRDLIHSVVNRKTCSGSTKNRYFALIRAILNKCVNEWDWLDKAPKLKLHKEPKKRIRWLYPEEARRLVNALAHLPYMQHLVIFSLATGLRQANVLNLKWEQIDLKRQAAWIYPDQAKAGKAIGVPLNHTAMQVLMERQREGEYVFTHSHGGRVKSISSRVWHEALEKAGIEDFRWHDLRHTWASWLVQNGTPLAALKEMGGWESVEMVQRYAHLAPEHLSQHARLIDSSMPPGIGLVQNFAKVQNRQNTDKQINHLN